MDPFNKTQTDRVWRRVLNTGTGQAAPGGTAIQNSGAKAPEQPERLLSMIHQARAAGACYLALSRRTAGRTAGVLRRMYEEKMNHVDCLTGIFYLLQGKRPSLPPAKPPYQGPLEHCLRRAYGESMRALALLEGETGQPECGRIFLRLAQQEQEHCRLLLELLGRGGRG